MPTAPFNTYDQNPLLPQNFPEDVRFLALSLPANLSLVKGQIVGIVTAANVNDVWTISSTGTLTSGNIVFLYAGVQHTLPVASTASQTAAIINANLAAVYGAGTYVTVTGGPLSTNTSLVITGAGLLVAQPVATTSVSSSIVGGGSVTYTHTTTGVASGSVGTYASGNSDGTQLPVAICVYNLIADALGKISMSDSALNGGQHGVKFPVKAFAYSGGLWNANELVGYDANAAAKLGRQIGSITTGSVHLS